MHPQQQIIQEQGSLEPHFIARFLHHAKTYLGTEGIRTWPEDKTEEENNGGR